ncbi:hypothetical protein N7523_006547 [Penicillium sp. IBT 18751x]|nr:hypothetical protein N7523_006547 [Penicillium sp. IBT 18751x]
MSPTLPNEVLLMVGEQIDEHKDRWNLIFVCRHFHNVFLTLAYEKVALYNWRDMRSFLHVIIRQVSLASSVRELDLRGWRLDIVSGDDWNNIENDLVLKFLVKKSSHSMAEATRWQKSLKQGHGDAWIALALPLLTHIRNLQFTYAARDNLLILTLQRAANGEKPFHKRTAFQYLQEVSCHGVDPVDLQEAFDDNRRTSVALLISFFHFPSMRTIDAETVIEPDPIAKYSNNGLGFSSVSEINLRASCGNYGMEALVHSCTNLMSFKYQHSDSLVHSHGYQPRAFYRSLARSKETLQTLWLDHYGSHYSFTTAGLNQNHDEWFGPLSDFTALQELRIRLTNLLDFRYQTSPTTPLIRCLPQSLETLYIEGCEERHLVMLVSQLHEVLKDRLTCVPRLQLIDIEGPFQNAPSHNFGDANCTIMETTDSTLKSNIIQAVEPLHTSCVAAGVILCVHDRAFTQSSHI